MFNGRYSVLAMDLYTTCKYDTINYVPINVASQYMYWQIIDGAGVE